MAEIALLATTGNEPIDRALHGIVGAYEAAFPGRVRGYYLLGSYAEGNAVAVSDIVGLRPTQPHTGYGYVRLARSAVLLYGEDTRARLPLPDRLTYRRQVTEAPLHFVVKHLRGGPPVAFPLDYPDAGDRLLGYDPPGLAAYFYPPSTPGGTKTLVVTACWIATATVALATGRMVGGKSEAVRAYREDIGDEWSGFLERQVGDDGAGDPCLPERAML